MKTVQVHRYHVDEKRISPYYVEINTDIDTNDRVMRLYGLKFGYAMEKISDNVYENQYGEAYTVIRNA